MNSPEYWPNWSGNACCQKILTRRVVFELPRDMSHGDLATNAAMILAKPAQKLPRDLAAMFAAEFEKLTVSLALKSPGFVNLRVLPILWARQIADIIEANGQYGRSQIGAGACEY